MTTYAGFELLDQVIPNRRGQVPDRLTRKTSRLQPGTGISSGDDLAALGNPVRPFSWPCFSRAEVAVLRAFLDARRGRVAPVWVPTWQSDLALAADAASGATALTLRWAGYTRHLHPMGAVRRHLALWSPGQALTPIKVTTAADPDDGVTESAQLSTPLPRAFPAASTLVMFMRLCRLEEDLASIEWASAEVAECDLSFRELPMEVPA